LVCNHQGQHNYHQPPDQVICSYLNKVFGWGPPDPQSQAHIDQTLAVVADGVGDGRLAFHPVNFYASHKTQASSGWYAWCGARAVGISVPEGTSATCLWVEDMPAATQHAMNNHMHCKCMSNVGGT
jgi:hypothetical protein